jgi:hypothetical protein
MIWNRFSIGYHGCDAEVVRRIMGNPGEMLKPSDNDYDWLGPGQYFWEGSFERALQWAQSSPKIETPAVLGALIDLGECLNLTETKALTYLRGTYDYMARLFAETNRPMPRNKGKEFTARYLDCAVFRMLHETRAREGLPPFDTVRAFFVEGAPLYEGAGIRELDHIQICVRNPGAIVGYFPPNELYRYHSR